MCDEETGGALEVALRGQGNISQQEFRNARQWYYIAVRYIDEASIIGIASFERWRYE